MSEPRGYFEEMVDTAFRRGFRLGIVLTVAGSFVLLGVALLVEYLR